MSKYKNVGKIPKPYHLIYWDGDHPSQIEEFRTKDELEKVIDNLLEGKPLIQKNDYSPSNQMPIEIYPERFYTTEQFGSDYVV